MNTNELAARARLEVQPALERQLAPLGQRAMAALGARPGERILDLGCGTGQTARDLADVVGPHGAVLGIDVSSIAIEEARRSAGDRRPLSFVEDDAATHAFAPAAFDAAFSRFGVMFFADPVAAFANIRRALKRGGRLAFVCWRALAENAVDSVPLLAALPYLPPQPADGDGPGPFSFADPDRVRSHLTAAGFVDIAIVPDDRLVPSGDIESALRLALRVGSLGKIVRESPALHDVVAGAVRAALLERNGPDGVWLNAATWIVTARA